MTTDELAKIIFDWFNRPGTAEDDGGPYTYNPDEDDLIIGVDGALDCRRLATALLMKLAGPLDWQEIGRIVDDGVTKEVTTPLRPQGSKPKHIRGTKNN